ncbi:hypothetical protein LTR93_011803 [Exophiala xenobiotica]|nr:hypothetical protein LTR93_011803 [Exophiala xenobiotica]
MSDLLSKLTDQLSNQKKSQGGQQSSSSGILHKINDAVTGQKHPQDYQTQTNTNFSSPGFGGMGGGAYQQARHSVEIRANMAKWEVMAATVLAIRIMGTKDMGKIKDMVVMDKEGTAVTDRKATVVTEDKKATVVTEDKKAMVVMDKKAMVITEDK